MTDRTVMTRVKGDVSDFQRAMMAAKASVRGVREEINTTNDRTAWLAQGFMALAPAIAPLGAAAIPMLAGLSTGLFMAGSAAGVMLLAFDGMGDALDAVNEYSIEPTTDNLVKMQQALEDMGPAGAQFAMFLDSLRPVVDDLQDAAREGMFPGFEEGIESLLARGPQVEEIIRNIAEGIGELAADGGADLASERWTKFFDYMENDAKPIILDMGRTLGNLVLGISNVMIALDPATQDFSSGLLKFSRDFAEATANLETNQGFQEFLDYVHTMGPEVVDLIVSISNAIIQLLEAAAPIGHVLIPGLTALFDVIAAIADTPLGTIFIALGAAVGIYGRAVALAEITTGRMGKTLFASTKTAAAARFAWRDLGNAVLYSGRSTAQIQKEMAYATEAGNKTLLAQQTRAMEARGAVTAYAKSIGPAVAQTALLAAVVSGYADKVGASNAATGALIGSFGGPWGAAVGAGVGGLLDLKSSFDAGSDSVETFDQNVEHAGDSIEQLRAAIKLGRQDLATMNEDFGAEDFFNGIYEAIGLGDTYATAEERMADRIVAAREKIRQERLEVGSGVKEGADALYNLLGPSLDYTSDQFHVASQSAAEFEESLASINALLEKRGSLRDYAQALADFSETVKENGRGLNVFTDEGRETQAALDKIADSALKYARNLRGLDRVKFLANARRGFIDAAMAAGKTRKAAQGLADDLGLIGRKTIRPKIDKKPIEDASGAVTDLDSYLDDLTGHTRSIPIDADTSSARSKLDTLRAAISSRMVIPVAIAAPGKAEGGYTGDGAKHEVAGIVHRGEVVIPQELVRRDRSMLWSRYGHLPGMADGGLAGSAGFGSGINFGGPQLQALIVGLRDAIHHSERALRNETRERDKLAKKLAKEQAAYDALINAQADLSKGIQSGLTVDPFTGETNPWAPGATPSGVPSFDKIIKTIVDATITAGAFEDAESYIGQYLTGGAFESVVASGNADLVNAFAKFTPAQLAEYQAKYDAMTGAQKGAGDTAGSIRFDAEIADQAEVVGHLRERVTRMNQRIRSLERLMRRYEKMLDEARDAKEDRKDRAEKAKKGRESKRSDDQRESDASAARGNRVAVDVNDGSLGHGVAGLRRDVRDLAAAIAGSQDRAADKIVAGVGGAFTKGTRAGVRRAR